MALVDANYRFIFVDVGCQGRLSDGGVYRNTEFYRVLVSGELNLPPDRKLPNLSDINDSFLNPNSEKPLMPYVFVADDAFPLSRNCMKPYSQQQLSDSKRIFKYRLSRARRTTENAFGISIHRFRALASRLNVTPETATKIVLASCVLHNLLLTESSNTYTPVSYADELFADGEIQDGEWRSLSIPDHIVSLEATHSRNYSRAAEDVRSAFCDYFEGPGQVPWQWRKVFGS